MKNDTNMEEFMLKEKIIDNYYKAYDKRYYQVHSNNMLWSTTEPTN